MNRNYHDSARTVTEHTYIEDRRNARVLLQISFWCWAFVLLLFLAGLAEWGRR